MKLDKLLHGIVQDDCLQQQGAEIKKFMLLYSVLCAMGGSAISIHKDEHLCYGVRMMNAETEDGMDMDHFSLSRGELLPTTDLLYCKSGGISTDISANRKLFLADSWLLRVPLG